MTDRTKVAFQGELGAYSELAARAFFEQDVEVCPSPTFEAVFEEIGKGTCTHGIIPIENSLAGSVHENYDLLLEHRLSIVGEIKLRIAHHLIANPGVRLADLKKIYSHPQALFQCRDFLRTMKAVEAVAVYDTAGAAKLIRDEGATDAAAIASAQAAVDYGLNVLRTGIESNHLNFTRFLIVSKDAAGTAENAKTSIVFSTRNIPGALFKSLSVFALRDIDLLKIESRPIHGRPWEYIFYLDFDGSMEDEKCQKAIGHLEEIALFLRILGSYPKGREVNGRIHTRA